MACLLRIGLLVGLVFGIATTTWADAPATAASASSAATARPGKSADQLFRDIAQRKDKSLRAARLDDLRAGLGGSPQEKRDALAALARLHDVPFDRTAILPVVRDLLRDSEPDVRAAALGAMVAAGAGEADLPAIAALADDPSATVRAKVVGAMVFAATGKGQGVITPVVEKLILDDADEVKLQAIHVLWGNPVSPAVEEELIRISRGPLDNHRALPYASVYYALSTRPVISLPVAKRLIEIMQGPDSSPDIAGRAAWGLNKPVAPEAVELVTEAMIRELDETLNPYIRGQAITKLAHVRTPEARAKLSAIADDPDEDQSIRKQAAEALGRR